MTKVYLYPQKIFKYFGVLMLIFGVISCASSQTTTTASGETDGVYYSPSKDGQVEYVVEENSNDYDIQVGSPYFDANGDGAEDFYYENPNTQNVNIYTGYNDVYVTDGTSNWGRYDGVDITINNWGWNNPWWGWNNYYGFGWNWGWSNYYYGYPRWNYWHSPYWGWGGYYGYNPYWSYYNPYYYNPYWGYGNGYYGGYYGNGYYYGVPTRSNRPGNYIAGRNQTRLSGVRGNYRNPFRPTTRNEGNVRQTRDGNMGNTRDNVRPVRKETPRTQNPSVRDNNVRENVRPVRATRPEGVRPNTPTRTTNPNIRTNTPRTTSPRVNSPRTNTRSNNNITVPRNTVPRNNSGIRTSTPSRSSGGGVRTSTPSRSSGSTGGGVRRR